jgi:hypothetical protein
MSEVTPVPVSRDQAVRDLIVALEATLRELLPGFTFLPTAQRRRITNAGSVPDDFLEAVAVAVESTPNVGAPIQLSPGELRDAIRSSRAFLSLADQLELMARGVRETVADRRAEMGKRALVTYAVAKAVNRHLDLTLAVPHFDNMRRALGRTGRKKRPGNPAPPPIIEGGVVTQKN